MTTVYFRILEGVPQLLFTPATSPLVFAEQLLLQEIAPQVTEDGVYRATREKPNVGHPRQIILEKVADATQTVALVYVTKQDDGSLSIEQTHIDHPTQSPTEEEMKALATAATQQAQSLPPHEPTWIFLAL